MPKQRPPRPEPETPPARPVLADAVPRFLLLEREVEIEYRPRMLAALQSKVDAVADAARGTMPVSPHCRQPMRCQDRRPVSWLARCGRLHAPVSRYRCRLCRYECRPLLDLLGVEPGRIGGSLARLLALLATVALYPLAARLAWLLLGVTISPMGIWRKAQRLGEAAAHHSDALSRYHADSRSTGAPTQAALAAVVLGVDGCSLGMQTRSTRPRKAVSAKSRRGFCCCPASEWKPPRGDARWCAGFW